MRRLLITAILFLEGLAAAAHADSTMRPTVTVIDEWLRDCMRTMVNSVQPGDTLRIEIAPHPDDAWLRATAVQVAEERGAMVVGEGGMASSKLSIVAVDVRTDYVNTDVADTITRTITVSLRGTLDTPRGGISSVPCSKQRQEHVHRDVAARLQSDQHASTHAVIPAKPTTFWQDILEPAIFVGAAVITAALLFTVRSQ